jgi:hypothetical protein
MFCKVFYRQNEESFLEGQISGLDYFGGAPRKVIFDYTAEMIIGDAYRKVA